MLEQNYILKSNYVFLVAIQKYYKWLFETIILYFIHTRHSKIKNGLVKIITYWNTNCKIIVVIIS